MPRHARHAGASPRILESRPIPANVLRGADHVQASFTPDDDGGGILHLRYDGPLAVHDALWIRFGERRGGADWVDTRDVRMEKDGPAASVRIRVGPGAPLEGACFAFFAIKPGHADPVWDSAGRPFGCYVLDARSGGLATR